ncbi:BON domain-containing protein [Vandammella animalimorsus]|uniref:BON domain-containing protein n=1 Tax=Vandammella animalimorsus TaxID=2029117 RepID=UPI001EEE33CC|nr:BON domain-containing protein [Vandammella animalimorsus]
MQAVRGLVSVPVQSLFTVGKNARANGSPRARLLYCRFDIAPVVLSRCPGTRHEWEVHFMYLKRFVAIAWMGVAGLSGLTGCAPLIVGGAVVATSVALDRRTAGAQVDDQAIQLKVRTAFSEQLGEQAHINVNSYNRRVLLTGEVPDEAQRQRAAQLAKEVENVRGVYNELQVMPASSYSQRSRDTWITGKVRSQILATENLPSKSLQVTTEQEVVYLQGLVTPREAEAATQAARAVSGVRKVVRMFELISEQELQKTLAEREARAAQSANAFHESGGPNQ